MTTLLFPVLFLLFSSPLSAPASGPAHGLDAGTWTGTLYLPGGTHFIDLELSGTAARPAGTLRLPSWSPDRRVPLQDIERRAPDAIAFTVEVLYTPLRFEGRWDGTAWRGTVRATNTNRLLGVKLGNRTLVEGRWEAAPYVPGADADLTARIRRALGTGALHDANGWSVRERLDRIDRSGTRIAYTYRFGPAGRYRRDRSPDDRQPEGFDGDACWTLRPDGLTETPAPQQAERRHWPALLRSYAWLAPDADVDVHLLGRTGGAQPAYLLYLRRRDGQVGVRLYVDAGTLYPRRAEIEWPQDLYEMDFDAYRPSEEGLIYPHHITTRYLDDEVGASVYDVALHLTPPDPFTRPADQTHAVFLDGRPPDVPVQRGSGRKGHHFVQPLIDGRPAGWFHLDSGASELVIDTRTADALGLAVIAQPAEGVTLRQAATLQVGPLLLQDPVFIARDLSDFNAPRGTNRGGILGYPVFAGAVVVINYEDDAVAIHDPAAYQLPREAWQDLQVRVRPVVTGRLEGGVTGPFVLDTGKSGTLSLRSPFAWRHEALLDVGSIALTPVATLSGDTYEYAGKLAWIELGGFRLRNPTVHIKIPGTYNSDESYAGIIGRGFLRHFTVVFDYPNRRIAFLPH